MTDAERQRIQKQLQEIDAWRASQLPLTEYIQQCGQTLKDWRGKLSWERRWRDLLQGKPLHYTTHPKPALAFVKAIAPTLPKPEESHIRLTLQSKSSGVLLAHIDWPLAQSQQCGQWLREVLV